MKISPLLLLFYFSNTLSYTYYLEIARDNNAPSLNSIVQDGNTSPPPPSYTLQAFNTIEPDNVKYLIDARAFGNLKNIMDSHPLWGLSRLQQYIVVTYNANLNNQSIKNSLANDPHVKNYGEIIAEQIPAVSVKQFVPNFKELKRKTFVSKNRPLKAVNAIDTSILSAWELSEGMGYISMIDTGIQINHPALRSFDENGTYTGGNLLDGQYVLDTAETLYDPLTGYPSFIDLNIDELQPIAETIDNQDCDFIDEDTGTLEVDYNNLIVASFVGHGSHTAGIISAKNGLAQGICKNCSLSMMKYYSPRFGSCTTFPLNAKPDESTKTYQFSGKDFLSFVNGLYYPGIYGVGVLNFSGGGGTITNPNPCPMTSADPVCLGMRNLNKNEIMYVASAGNDRQKLNFPARDKRVVAVGGLTEESGGQVDYWNDTPNGTDFLNFDDDSNCFRYHADTLFSTPPDGDECGSNHSFLPDDMGNLFLDHKTDVMAQARNVYSTFYQGKMWSPSLPNECSDAIDGIPNDGYGLCTGTSMSAPQVSAIYQLMRSAHPLLPNGDSNPNNLIGLRNVLNSTAEQFAGENKFSEYFGYGKPNARKALEIILGQSNGVQMKTRLTPMFDVVATDGNNNIYSAFPQIAVSFLLESGLGYVPNIGVGLVNEFTEFWYDNNIDNPNPNAIEVELDDPRAAFYVFTTNNNPFAGIKNMVPLRRMEKSIGANRNDTYAVSDAEIQSFHDDGYNYAGIEGYILPISQCNPTPCTGAIALYRDEADSMNHKLVPTNTAPPTSTLLGYVYLNQDTDGDGLIDGQEIILGTNLNNIDSDGDTVPDGVEYPAAGVPYSDPMVNDIIFKHGFET